MRKPNFTDYRNILFPIILSFSLFTGKLSGQNIRLGLFADPSVNWFSSNAKETVNKGSRAGFSFGLSFNKYFSDNYSLSTGISILNTGGVLYNTDSIKMSFNNLNANVPAREPVTYKIQYINIPLGLKMESNQIGYLTFFADVGLDPRFLIGGKVDIPSAGIEEEVAKNEINPVNLSYHIMGGIEYSLGGKTEMVFGLGFDHNFFDVTKDINQQPEDKVKNNIIKLRIGVNF